ncbi:hypothetical protein E2C01_051040 [Portunus trituberculatus]|uniref:Uncharacterized protein n=1 Tax=Portunus trituberculatus TaxID=210409 RepID=A0A5B7GJ45_PORTR|nr:hypothetical protein [Portunus trituberculatus]
MSSHKSIASLPTNSLIHTHPPTYSHCWCRIRRLHLIILSYELVCEITDLVLEAPPQVVVQVQYDSPDPLHKCLPFPISGWLQLLHHLLLLTLLDALKHSFLRLSLFLGFGPERLHGTDFSRLEALLCKVSVSARKPKHAVRNEISFQQDVERTCSADRKPARV